MENNRDNFKTYKIKDFVDLYNTEDSIPAIQRGLVWNSVRVEVLWDSLMRRIPIGSFSVRKDKQSNKIEILDGQQRANAISLAFTPLPNAQSKLEDKQKSLLWIDLGMTSAVIENEQGKPDKSVRRFFFRVTTAAHPWGYILSDNETTVKRFDFDEQKNVVEELNKFSTWENCNTRGSRPYPYELWPEKAICPVPFSIVYKFVSDRLNKSVFDYDKFLEYLKIYETTNWYKKFFVYKKQNVSIEFWNKICDSIKQVTETILFATDATEVAPDDIKTYFRRLNKSGVEPTAEEMKYSLLKASVPELKKLDELSNGLTSPARLANIVLRYCVSKNDEWKWKNDISLEEVIKLTEKDYNEIKDLVNNRLKNLIITIEKRTDLLLSYHRVRLSNAEKGDIFMLLLKLLENGESSINLSGLSMYLLWFSNKGKIQKAVETIWEASDINIKKGIWNAIDKSFTSLPLELSFFNKLNDMIDCLSENYDDRNQTFNLCKDIYQYIETYENKALFEKIINGFSKSEEGRDIVLFGCKKYMDDVFGGYDLSSPEWKEQNRPWDYDHIFPQSRMGKNIDDKDEYLYLLCNKMLQSFGNSCPLPFSENRGKNASLPEEDYPGGGYSDKVLVDTDDIRSYKNCGGEKLDATSAQNYALSICFLKGTSNRLAKLYSAWYNNCEIDELLSVSFNIIKAERRVLFLLEMLKNITEKFHHYIDIIQCTYTKYDGRQYKLDPQNPIDWAKGDGCWQSCGIEGTIKDSNEKCFLAVTTNGKDVEIGIRRHPELTQIQGTNDWYWPNRYHSFRFDDKEHKCKEVQEIADECLKYFEDYLQYINI